MFDIDNLILAITVVPDIDNGKRYVSIISLSNEFGGGGGGAVAQSVERATPGEVVLGSTSVVAIRSLLVGSMPVPAETDVMVSPLCLMCGST